MNKKKKQKTQASMQTEEDKMVTQHHHHVSFCFNHFQKPLRVTICVNVYVVQIHKKGNGEGIKHGNNIFIYLPRCLPCLRGRDETNRMQRNTLMH